MSKNEEVFDLSPDRKDYINLLLDIEFDKIKEDAIDPYIERIKSFSNEENLDRAEELTLKINTTPIINRVLDVLEDPKEIIFSGILIARRMYSIEKHIEELTSLINVYRFIKSTEESEKFKDNVDDLLKNLNIDKEK